MTTKNCKIGDWLEKRDPIYGGFSSGKITAISGRYAEYYDANAFDGMGGKFEAWLDSMFVEVR